MCGEREDRLRVDGHAALRTGTRVLLEQLVVVQDDPVVDADDVAVAHGMVVGRDRGMALRVVADVEEDLRRVGRNRDPLEHLARAGALLVDGRRPLGRAPKRVTDRVGAALGDPREQRPRGQRAVDAAVGGETVTRDSAHNLILVSAPATDSLETARSSLS